MFVQNKYTRIYHSIIESALAKNRVKRRSNHKDYEYFESHHIIPKSIGGSNDQTNLVILTPREHFICHYLLCKMVTYNSVEWHKVVQAFTYMYSASANHKRYKNSRLYALARREVGKIISKHQTGSGNSQFGTTWVTHLRNRHCCKIPLSELQTYKDQGYIEKRVINWDKQDQKQKAKREKILKDISRVNQKIAKLQDTKITLEGKMELLEGVKPS